MRAWSRETDLIQSKTTEHTLLYTHPAVPFRIKFHPLKWHGPFFWVKFRATSDLHAAVRIYIINPAKYYDKIF